jgi:hypothetical protein
MMFVSSGFLSGNQCISEPDMIRTQSAEHAIVDLLLMDVSCLERSFAPSNDLHDSGAANHPNLFDKNLYPRAVVGGAPGEMTCVEEKEASNFNEDRNSCIVLCTALVKRYPMTGLV